MRHYHCGRWRVTEVRKHRSHTPWRGNGRRWRPLRPSTAANRAARSFFKTQNDFRFFVHCICTHATGSRPPEHEACAHDAAATCSRMPRTTCLRFNIPTGQKISMDPAERKTLQVEPQATPQEPQPTRNVQPNTLRQKDQGRNNRNNEDTLDGPGPTTQTPPALRHESRITHTHDLFAFDRCVSFSTRVSVHRNRVLLALVMTRVHVRRVFSRVSKLIVTVFFVINSGECFTCEPYVR